MNKSQKRKRERMHKCFVMCLVISFLLMRADYIYPADIPNSIDIIIDDMTLPHEGIPHGVPKTWDWASRPRVNMGNNPGNIMARLLAWGQLYEDATGNPATNSQVQIRDIKAYMLSKRDNRWYLLQDLQLIEGGAAFPENFVGDSKPADIRYENDGSLSVTAGGAYNFHFWTPRAVIDPTDIGGIFTTVRARLVVNNPSLPDDRNQARYLLDMGGDYYLADGTKLDDIGIGRFKYVKPEWQSFNMSTLSESEIRQNPPPFLHITAMPWLLLLRN